MRNKMATADPAISQREKEHTALSTRIAAEGIVLLKNSGVLPFSENVHTIALFGSGARRTIKGGTGSGDVNVRNYVTVEQGLKNAGFTILSELWLSEHETLMMQAQKEYDDQIRALAHQGVGVALLTMMGKPFREPEFRGLRRDDLAEADAAVYVLARSSGEGADRKVAPGDYLLNETERHDIALLSETYSKFVLLLNVGGVVDIECVRELPGAIVLMSQGGSGGGDAIAQVLAGQVNPSGKLTVTWGKRYEDYPFASEFAVTPDDAWYKEGIYVGYRWFESFGIAPRYPFGFGLSYTKFDLHSQSVSVENGEVSVKVSVTNVGLYSGKEVVQVYAGQPAGRSSKAVKVLAGFQKTELLPPGKTEQLTITFPIRQLASYDDKLSAWLLERGDYGIYVGNSSADTALIAALSLDSDVVTQRCQKLFRNEAVNEIAAPAHTVEYNCPKIRVDISQIKLQEPTHTDGRAAITSCGGAVTFRDVCIGRASAEDLVCQMTQQEMALLCIGAARVSFNDFSVIGNASKSIPGAAGDTTGQLVHYGLPQCAMADGPAGIRVNPKVYERADGYINNIAEDPIMSKILPSELQEIDLSGTTVKYQYCTALPIAVQLAQTWDPPLLEAAGDMVGAEMEELGIDLWLAPGMNIQRNPLCGRNFEYYSEDPLLSGIFAAALTWGVQRHPGKGVCIKHLVANNQETNRATSNSHVSEQALREIYLKGYEICVKSAHPFSAMTSMNLLNGIHTANDPDLLIHALRDEWGFDGVVMTDWGITGSYVTPGGSRRYGPATPVGCINAGNDLIMPGTSFDEESLLAALEDGSLPTGALRTCAVRIVKLLVKCSPGMGEI